MDAELPSHEKVTPEMLRMWAAMQDGQCHIKNGCNCAGCQCSRHLRSEADRLTPPPEEKP